MCYPTTYVGCITPVLLVFSSDVDLELRPIFVGFCILNPFIAVICEQYFLLDGIVCND